MLNNVKITRKILLLLVGSLLLVAVILLAVFNRSQIYQNLSAYLYWFSPNTYNSQRYLNTTLGSDHLKEKTNFTVDNNSALFTIVENLPEKEENTLVNIRSEYIQEEQLNEFNNIKSIDGEFIENSSYILPGSLGREISYYESYYLKNALGEFNKQELIKKEILKPTDQATVSGAKPVETLENYVKQSYEAIIKYLKENNLAELNKLLQSEISSIAKDDTSSFENTKVTSVNIFQNSQIIAEDKFVPVGNIDIFLENCFENVGLSLQYNYESKTYFFGNFQEFFNSLCAKKFDQVGNQFIGRCADCTWYPVNKQYGLRADYTPTVVASNVPGNQLIHTQAYDDLQELYTAARDSGYYLHATSGYRSYSIQSSLFEIYTQNEMALGRSRAEAEEIANTYSARPGFSEHQLGTTLDITNTACNGALQGCNANNSIYDWLAENAYRYGFALSYPQGKESLTGYIYEPWHYRWIGKEFAKEFKDVEPASTLQEFLFSKGRY